MSYFLLERNWPGHVRRECLTQKQCLGTLIKQEGCLRRLHRCELLIDIGVQNLDWAVSLTHCNAVQASAWPRCVGAHVPNKAPAPMPSGQPAEDQMRTPEHLSTLGSCMKAALSSICEAVIRAAPDLDALDAK